MAEWMLAFLAIYIIQVDYFTRYNDLPCVRCYRRKCVYNGRVFLTCSVIAYWYLDFGNF